MRLSKAKKITLIMLILGISITVVISIFGYSDEFERFVDKVNDKNIALTKPNIDYSDWIVDYDEYGFEELQRVHDLEFDSYKEDVEFLFGVLKYTYGPYAYFGGEEVFNQAKQTILQKIDEEQGITKAKFESILRSKLKFIEDTHFSIGNALVNESKYSYQYHEAFYYKDYKGIFRIDDGEKYYLIKVNGEENVVDYLKSTIDLKGQLAYQIGIFDDQYIRERKLEITLSKGGEQYNETIELIKATTAGANAREGDYTVFKEEIIEGIPIVTLKQMVFEHGKDAEIAHAFLETAKSLQTQNTIIIDLRNNGGGNGVLPAKWLYNYSGEIAKSNGVQLSIAIDKLMGQEQSVDTVDAKDNPYYVAPEDIEFLYNPTPISEYWVEDFPNRATELIENKNLIFILVNTFSASSSEIFVDLARDMENVVIVGTNTSGTLFNSATFMQQLPFSKTRLTYGADLRVWQDGVFAEGQGFQPDIWIGEGDALERTINLIKNYKLDQ